MAEEAHDPVHFLVQLRQAVSADKLALGFLLGAGCPCSVPSTEEPDAPPLIPDVRGLTAAVANVVSASEELSPLFDILKGVLAEDECNNANVEQMLNVLRSLRAIAGNSVARGFAKADLAKLDEKICGIIRDVVDKNLPERPNAYHSLARYIGSNREPAVEVFTTNYDLLLEQALEREQVPYFDGFVGSAKPFFDQISIEGEEIPKRWARLWKLHGSLNWRYNKITKRVFKSADCSDGEELLIHPSHLKYDESRRMPYFVMLDRLRTFIRNKNKPVAFIISGYSFGDEHINEAIVDCLKSNPSAACFAFMYGKLADYSQASTLAKETPNLSILALDAAIIRRRPAPWVTSASSDPKTLAALFTLIEEEPDGDEPAKGGDTELPRKCRMELGNFATLGIFLDSMGAGDAWPKADVTNEG